VRKGKAGWFQGKYNVINKEKYIGRISPIYRSSYELRFFTYCDKNENVLRWGSEIIEIPYQYSLDKYHRIHKYIVDIYCEMLDNNKELKKYLFEIKPKDGLSKPNPPKIKNKKAMRTYNYKLATFIRNKDKWRSAVRYCNGKGWEFKILTEKELHI